jgi:tetratricopeptide (TPR) repeat protein
MPLGVELAATWIEMLSPEEIASEIESSLDFLEAERRDAPERHHSLRAVFDYTWELLSEGEQKALSRISVFRGGFTTEAAREVVGASLKQLQGLMNKSLLHRNDDGRYDIHELLRQYAADKLDDKERLRTQERHCEYFIDFLHNRRLEIGRGHITEGVKEIDNIHACYRWAIANKHIYDLRKSGSGFGWIHHMQGRHAQALEIYQQAIQTLDAEPESELKKLARGIFQFGIGWCQAHTGEPDKGLMNIRKGNSIIRKHGNKLEVANNNYALCAIDDEMDNLEKTSLMKQNLTIFDEIGETRIRDEAITYLARIAMENQEWEKARSLLLQAVEYTKETNNLRLLSISYRSLGNLAFKAGNYPEAKYNFKKSLSTARTMDYRMFVSVALILLSELALLEGEYEETKKYIQESLSIAKYSGDPYREAESLRLLGILASEEGDFEQAEAYFRASLNIYNEVDLPLGIGLITCDFGNLALAKGDVRKAAQKYHGTIQKGIKLDPNIASMLFVETFSYLALFFAQISEKERAVELAALTQVHPNIHPYEKSKMTKLLEKLQEEMTQEEFAAAQERGRARDLEATAEEMLAILEKGDLD